MSKTVNTKILIRRDTSANWSLNNPILAAGEIGFDTTAKKHKIGDGSTAWNSLPYFALETDLTSLDISKITYFSNTSAYWATQTTLVSIADVIYIYTDYQTITEGTSTINIPGVKIGDGTTYVVDLPFVTVTETEKTFWNDKVRCYLSSTDTENLIFTTN